MADRTLNERLDDLVEAMLMDPDAPAPAADRRLAGVLRVASDLRGLPTEEFRTRLRERLVGAATAGEGEEMAIAATTPGARPGFPSVTPYLQVQRPAALLEFVRRAFGATETLRTTGEAGGMHAEARVGDSMLMIGGAEGMPFPEHPTSLHLYVPDADATYARALDAGAKSLYAPMDQAYGDREGGVEDPTGNHWYIGTRRAGEAQGYRPEGLRSVTLSMHLRGADRMVGYLKDAFGAEEVFRYQSPEGVIRHAKVRIGDSIVEMGEAHGAARPMPAAIYLYVDNVDAVYERAIGAGGVSTQPPTDQPYGDRNAFVRDPFGNTWYIATHMAERTGG